MRAARPPLLALLLLVGLPGLAWADLASLRPHVVVEDEVVRLGDVFADLGSEGTRVLGPAPPPGQRIIVETPQLLAIARGAGISWRPFASDERVVIERAGRALAREEWLEPLQEALSAQGLDPAMELEIPGFTTPMVPLSGLVRVEVAQPWLDGRRFGATLVLAAEGMPTQRLRIAGRGHATAPVAIATRRLALGEVVRAGDVQVQRLRTDRLRPGLAEDASLVVGQQLRRPVMEGAPFALRDLGAPVLIEKNTTVTMVVERGGLLLTAQGRALEAAPRDGVVNVMNLSSRQIVEAQAIGPGRVRVGPPAR
ncbi:flagellar basal body P-ring formation chaperone FlgA [Roseomonas mucosa]|nr:flagellar basal body P-ring formation chaperone FlgA [Roseomonas mucosa]